jgi:response regulator NasT
MNSPLRIAIADDEVDMRDYLARILPRMGFEVVSAAATGKQLVEDCLAHQPDLVITDIRMPEMDGIEAAIAISRQQAVPIILLSAYHDPDLVQRAQREHVVGYLIKPVKQADLSTAIGQAVARIQQFQGLPTDDGAADETSTPIEEATRIVMRRRRVSQADALAALEQAAAAHGQSLEAVAQSVILADELLFDSAGI